MTDFTSDRDAMLRRYLLGGLAEEERTRVEEDFFRDDDVFEELRAIEDELAYEYAEGSLSPLERGQYERQFLGTEDGRRRVDFARALKERLAAAPPARVARRVEWRWLAAAAVVMIAVGAVWLARRNVPPSTQEAARSADQSPRRAAPAPPAGEPQAAPPEPEVIATLLLTPGLVRGGGTLPQVRVGPEVAAVRIQLAFESPTRYLSYRLVLRSAEGAELWARPAEAAPSADDLVRLTTTIPARVLAAGDYELTAFGRPASGQPEEAATAYFRVTR